MTDEGPGTTLAVRAPEMTDKDLLLLLDEEYRLYNAYIDAMNGRYRLRYQNISDTQVKKAQKAWLSLHEKLRARVSPERRRELLQSRVKITTVRRTP